MVIIIGGREIPVDFCRKEVKNINLRVTRRGVAVSAPKGVSEARVEEFLRSKEAWIAGALEKCTPSPQAKIPDAGDTVSVFGQPCTVALCHTSEVGRQGDVLFLPLAEAKRQRALESYLKAVLKEEALRLCRLYYPIFGILPEITVRNMHSRWGSCLPTKGKVTLATALVHKDLRCVELVVVHELCHFSVPNHTDVFYRKLGSILPDYRERKKRLECK